MSFDVGAATYESATPRGRHRIRASFTKKHAYLFDLWDNPPAWYDVPDTDLQPLIAKALIEAAEAGEADIRAMSKRCSEAIAKLVATKKTLFAGSGAMGAFATFPEADRIQIGWIGHARVYRLGAKIEQLSRDHSLLHDYLRHVPDLSEEQREELGANDITTRAIGMRSEERSSETPDVLECTLGPDEWLVLVPRGIDETILGHSRVRAAKTAEAAAQRIVALAIEADADAPAGAIVIRRSLEASVAPDTVLRDLIARCPDRSTESVLADWCEENGRHEMVPWLRSEDGDVRANAVHHLGVTLEAQEITAEVFRSALRLFRTLPPTEWLKLAEDLVSISPTTREAPSTFFVEELRYDGPTPSHVKWAIAEEVLDRLAEGPRAPNPRIVPLARIVTKPCPECGRVSLVVAQDRYRTDGAGDPAWSTWVTALCVYEPHTRSLGVTSDWYEPTSE